MASPNRRVVHAPTIVEVAEVYRRTPIHTTVAFDYAPQAAPGQFLMVWLPGVDEVPMSLATSGVRKLLVARSRGTATSAMCELRPGDRIGVRGPYGHPFSVTTKRNLAVGGGTGMAPLVPLLTLGPSGAHWTMVIGAATAGEVLFADLATEVAARHGATLEVKVATEDGSEGTKGYPTAITAEVLRAGGIEAAFTCGPEPLMAGLFAQCEQYGVPLQASLERYMKCGFGICDACSLSGYLCCLDGPVFGSPQLRQMSEFGRVHRSSAGLPEKA